MPASWASPPTSVRRSTRGRSGDDTAVLQRDDPFPVVAELEQNLLGVLTVLRGRRRGCRLLVELNRVGRDRELSPAGGLEHREISVGDHLRVVVHLSRSLQRRPHALDVGKRFTPFVQRPRKEYSLELL